MKVARVLTITETHPFALYTAAADFLDVLAAVAEAPALLLDPLDAVALAVPS